MIFVLLFVLIVAAVLFGPEDPYEEGQRTLQELADGERS